VYGISAEATGYVWVTETKTGVVRRLRMSDGNSIWVTGLGADGYPYDVVVDLGRDFVWLTERHDSQISQIELGTLFLANSFDISPTSNFLPTGLTRVGNDQFWFAGLGAGQIGRLDYVSTKEFDFAVFDLPLSQLWALDIAADSAGHLWSVAYSPHRLSMPVMMKSH
jgi:DNA-binding beta-propeller fold protein YncE